MMNELMSYLNEGDVEDISLDAADESAIFLAAMQEECTAEEYNALVMENATELALYGLIDNADIVTEAKKISYKQTKQLTFTREQSRAVMRLARKNNDPEYKKYKMYHAKMKESRDKLRTKYGSKAKTEAKQIINGARRKASSMNSVTGKTISDKMDKRIKEMSSK